MLQGTVNLCHFASGDAWICHQDWTQVTALDPELSKTILLTFVENRGSLFPGLQWKFPFHFHLKKTWKLIEWPWIKKKMQFVLYCLVNSTSALNAWKRWRYSSRFFFLISSVVSLLYGSLAKVPCCTLAITNQQMLGEKRALFVDLFMAHMLRTLKL